jgi:L-histidine N-alpha-methyltransferase
LQTDGNYSILQRMAYEPFAGSGALLGHLPFADTSRLRIDVFRRSTGSTELADDVRRGLLLPQKTLPPKYFYDDRGSQLFDAICDLPEYYLTRVGQALLDRAAAPIVRAARPAVVVEFGSGSARMTRTVLDALEDAGHAVSYVPMDVSEGMLRHTARALLRDYPRLRIHGIVGDYERDLHRLPVGRQRLVLFLGSTIGNLSRGATADFLRALRRQLVPGDYFLLGVDLVKPVEILEAAYNDRAGVTAEFNRNVLRVINRELNADFAVEGFEHVAFFNRERSQIEMHLRARVAHHVTIRKLPLTVPFAAGETIHTEISRKFTRDEVEVTLRVAGFQLVDWYTPPNKYFALALSRVA